MKVGDESDREDNFLLEGSSRIVYNSRFSNLMDDTLQLPGSASVTSPQTPMKVEDSVETLDTETKVLESNIPEVKRKKTVRILSQPTFRVEEMSKELEESF